MASDTDSLIAAALVVVVSAHYMAGLLLLLLYFLAGPYYTRKYNSDNSVTGIADIGNYIYQYAELKRLYTKTRDAEIKLFLILIRVLIVIILSCWLFFITLLI